MSKREEEIVQQVAQGIEARIIRELDATPLTQFDDLLDVKNLKGESTGYVKTFTADKLQKGTSVSIDVMPGARYFNIHLIPEPHYNIPRFLFEGMLMGPGSQLSADLFPDIDIPTNIMAYRDQFKNAGVIYERARLDERLDLKPSRLLHMRAYSSPLFLLVLSVPLETALVFEEYAEAYLDEWLAMYRNPVELDEAAVAERRQRRQDMAGVVKALDPDRHMVVTVYGEETTCRIEEANMY